MGKSKSASRKVFLLRLWFTAQATTDEEVCTLEEYIATPFSLLCSFALYVKTLWLYILSRNYCSSQIGETSLRCLL